MGIQLSKIRISQFRSVKECEIAFDDLNLIFGQNNVGKSNILKAITIALNSTYPISEQDIHVEKGEEASFTKKAIIDLMIRPIDNNGHYIDNFSDFWVSVFTADWISYDANGHAFVGIRTTIEYNLEFGQYAMTKSPIQQWNENVAEAVCERNRRFTQDMQSYIFCFYLDAQRDIIEDIKNKKSYFGRATSSRDLPDELIREIEEDLNAVNTKIVEHTPALRSTQEIISAIGSVVGKGTELQIEPISRRINDLQRGMDVKLFDKESAALSISEQGMGTRSWVSVLTLGAYIINLTKQLKTQDPDVELFVVLTLEEPEAHLHAHAQKRLFDQITSFPGQKVISTHSASILAQAPIESLVHLYKTLGCTKVHRMDKEKYTQEEIAIVQRELVRTKGDLLFSSAIVLAEGITEEYALPIFYQEFFKQDAYASGVSIVGICGQRYKAFLHLVKDFEIPWFIFSDGEDSTIRTVKKAVEAIYGPESPELSNNVVFIENGDNYESYLVSAGYAEIMIDAINHYERLSREELFPEDYERDPRDYFDRFIQDHNHEKNGTVNTGKKCPTCEQPIRKETFLDYDGEEGRTKALLDIFKKKNAKAKYAVPIAKEITSRADKKVPQKIQELFMAIEKQLSLEAGVNDD